MTRFSLAAAALFLLPSCYFKEPVFNDGFVKVDPALNGVWAAEQVKDDPRRIDFAVCVALDDDRYLVNQPAGHEEGIYYEARPIKLRDRTLLQLRILASLKSGVPNADAEKYTVLWVEKQGDQSLRVRGVNGELKDGGPAEAKKRLTNPGEDWDKLFGDPMTYRRLKDE